MREIRVAFPQHETNWVNNEDIRVSAEMKMGQRFNFDVSDLVLKQIGSKAIEHMVKRMGEEVAYAKMAEIQSAADKLLLDVSWLKPIIENEIRRTTRDWVMSLWSDDEKKNMRDWFDVFTAKCREENK